MDAYLYSRCLVLLGVDARDQIHVSWRVWVVGSWLLFEGGGASVGSKGSG